MYYRCLSVLLLGLMMSLALQGCTGSEMATEVRVQAADFKFDSSQTTFEMGKPYRFVVTNAGTVAHEWMITRRGMTDHMMSMVGVSDNQLKPGVTVSKEFTFKEAGEYEFACHAPGHYEAGMALPVTVR